MTTDAEIREAIAGIYKMEPEIRRITGKEVADCTADDLTSVSKTLAMEAAAMQAEADQADMVLAEAERCGCRTIAIPGDDISRAVVVHECGGGR